MNWSLAMPMTRRDVVTLAPLSLLIAPTLTLARNNARAVRPDEPETVRLPIFVYHLIRERATESTEALRLTVSPDVFESQMSYLTANGYETILLSDLAEHFREGRPLPEKAVILTFDDGWEEQFETAVPILRKYGHRATFFVVTDYVGHREFLSWDQIRTLASYGMTIGSHSRHHPNLAEISNAEELRDEIETSKTIIEREAGTSIDAFAYPYGAYNHETIAAVERAGYTTARADKFGLVHSAAELYTLKIVTASNDLQTFEKMLAAAGRGGGSLLKPPEGPEAVPKKDSAGG